MTTLQQQTGLGNQLPTSDIVTRLRAQQKDTRTREQRAADRVERRRRHGYRPVDCFSGQEVAEVRPMTYAEQLAYGNRVAGREELIVLQVRSYIDWLVTTPGPATPEQTSWLEHAASESLISTTQLAALEKWQRRHTRAQRKTQSLGEIAAAAVRRSWY